VRTIRTGRIWTDGKDGPVTQDHKPTRPSGSGGDAPARRAAPGAGNRFARTREAHRDETAEDYVEAIAELIDAGGEARVKDLASMMGVSHVTVSRIVSRLVGEGLVETQPYKPTRKGRRLAAESKKRHEIVLGFLLAIGVPPKQAQIDAEGIEHHVSKATIKAMERVLAERD